MKNDKLVLEDINFGYDKDKLILKDFNLSVKDNEFITLFGKSGAGKSTILKLICGLEYPLRGKIYLDGEDISYLLPNKRNIVMTLQDSYLFPHMNVKDNIAFGMRIRGIDKKKIDERVRELLGIVELEGYEKKKPKELSGGEKKRISLCRAVSFYPKALLLDEPFVGLDDEMRFKMRDMLKNIHEINKMTTILVTHDRDDAEYLSDRIVNL